MTSRHAQMAAKSTSSVKGQGLWPFSSAPRPIPANAYSPMSGTPPSPSARQARLLSPSHSLPAFLPVLDESSTLKAPLILPNASGIGSLHSRPPLPLPAHSSKVQSSNRDIRRLTSFPSSSSLLTARLSHTDLLSQLSSSSSGTQNSGSGQPLSKGLGSWWPHLVIFSMLCLVFSVAVCVSYVDQYTSSDTGTFFQISDIHWDPLYRYHANPGSFCRTDLLEAPDRPFGQYGCDSPLLLLKTALMEMSAACARPDFILVTGDSVAHNLTARQTLHALSKVDGAIAQTFDPKYTKRLHAVGVQELAVLQARRYSLTEWLASLARVWNSTLVEASDDAYNTFLKGGYYMAVLPSQATAGPAMRAAASDVSSQTSNVAALVLNTMLYSTHSAARPVQQHFGSAQDPAGQLAWLQEQLRQARHWGRKVVIAGHIPPGVDTLTGTPTWQEPFEQWYTDIVLQHSDVVVGQLFGYLHRDHFTLMHADNSRIFPGLGKEPSKKHPGLLTETVNLKTRPREVGGETESRPSAGHTWARRLHEVMLAQFPGSSSSSSSRSSSSIRSSSSGSSSSSTRFAAGKRLSLMESGGKSVPAKSQLKSVERVGWSMPTEDHPSVIDGGSSAAVLVAPSLSPVLKNRPAFRAFSYDRAGLLLDYKQHTADLQLQGAEKMWEIQYGARSVYKLNALDASDFADLSSHFFNASGYPTKAFSAFCDLRAAGNEPELSSAYDCCRDCPNFMRCAVECASFRQFQGCNDSLVEQEGILNQTPSPALVHVF